MGRTLPKGGPAFQLTREDTNRPTYSPGDTIVGLAHRQLPLVSPDATVTVTLCGRTKTKMVVKTGQSTNTYRGRFSLIDEYAHTQALFRGPVHIPPGGGAQTWPFAIEIPTRCCAKLAGGASQSESYISLDPAAQHPLPESFGMAYSGFHHKRESFVEYFLKATLSYTHQGSRRCEEAILPIRLSTPDPGPPIADFRLRRHRQVRCVSSFKLLPGMDDAQLTFHQKVQQSFGSSKVPRIGGTMEMDLPSTLQLDNPSTIPVRLRYVPNASTTSAALIEKPPKLVLVSMHMQVETQVDIRCAGTFSPHNAEDTSKTRVPIWPPLPRGVENGGPLYIPCTDECPPVDVGERAGFRIYSANSYGFGGEARLQPDFTTYNIKRRHLAKLEFVVRAEEVEMRLEARWALEILPSSGSPGVPAAGGSAQIIDAAVRVGEEALPPPPFHGRSESWIKPPVEGEAPPTFAEVKKEDAIAGRSHEGGENGASRV